MGSQGSTLGAARVNDFSRVRQLTLPMQVKSQASFANYHAFNNQRVVSLLQDFLDQENEETLVLLSGAAGSGKTHLLSAALHELEGRRIGARFYGLSEIGKLDEELDYESVFEGIEDYSFVLMDDLDQWVPNPLHERILFNLYNQFKMSGQKLIVSSRLAPRQLRLNLADLQSRLNSGLILNLLALNDSEKTELLIRWGRERGFYLASETAAFILQHSERSVSELLGVIERLDQASLTQKNRVTLPFIKKVFGW